MFIDHSLAKGIRRAYLESLDQSWNSFIKICKKEKRRQPYLQLETRKGFDREIEKLRKGVEGAGLMQSEITIKTKHRSLWASLFLRREVSDGEDAQKGMTPTGHARAEVFALAFPPARQWVKPMSVRITAHAIDRVIQRMGLVDLPIRSEDIRAVNTEISQALIWAVASFFILGKTDPKDAERLTLIFPSQHGFFIGKFDTEPIELVLLTYVDRDNTWPEQVEAFKILDAITDSQLALFASDIIARHHVKAEHTEYDNTIYRCWRDYGWRIKEKIDRPGRLQSARESRPISPQR